MVSAPSPGIKLERERERGWERERGGGDHWGSKGKAQSK
jgi:hypothetical protein